MEKLNRNQKKAVQTTEGPLAIIATAGAGKTHVLIERTKQLLKNKVKPKNILCITFTIKACNEIKERIGNNDINVMTYHKLGYNILKDYNSKYRILNSSYNTIMKFTKDKSVVDKISMYKNTLDDKYIKDCKKVFMKYIKYTTSKNLVDMDDMIYMSNIILSRNKKLRHKWQNKFKYIMCDEHQDINNTQYNLLNNILNHKNICVIGDPDQAIYGWRGSNFKYLTNFTDEYPDAKKIILNVNYRSNRGIVDLANMAINPNEDREKKIVKTIKKGKVMPDYNNYGDNFIEMKGIIRKIKIKSKNLTQAIILRTNYDIKVFELEFILNKINYNILGDDTILNDPRYKLVLDIIKYSINKNHNINRLHPILKQASNKYSLLENIDINLIMNFIRYDLNMNKYLKKTSYKNMDKILNWFEIILSNFNNIYEFINYIDNITSKNFNIKLLTYHSSKGLEFNIVYLPLLNEGIMPNINNLDINEERRLFFVGITRAKDELYLSSSKVNNDSRLSRFLMELDDDIE